MADPAVAKTRKGTKSDSWKGASCSYDKTLDLCEASQNMDLSHKLIQCVNKDDGNRQMDRWTDEDDDNNPSPEAAEG